MMLQCPICHVAFVYEVLDDYQVQARRNHEMQVGGLRVLTCCNGHIFFVRESDLPQDLASGAAA